MKRTLLLDGDIFIYRITAALETPIDWGNDLWTLHCDLGECKEALNSQIAEYKEKLNATDVILAFSPKTNFRYRILQTYKCNRKGKRKPVCYVPLKEYAIATYPSFQRPDIEGDDVLGILATSPVIVKGEKVIVSLDKDMKTIPCLYCDMRDPVTVQEITEEQANWQHMYQTLIGDTADGYTGCPGVGPVAATKLLDGLTTYEQMWPVVVAAYAKKGLNEDVALVQAQVARICRRDDYDFKRKEVILWTPKK
jgi:DNA polymerase I